MRGMSASVLNNFPNPLGLVAFNNWHLATPGIGAQQLPAMQASNANNQLASATRESAVDTEKLKARLLQIVRECVPFEQRARVTCLMSIRLDGGHDSLSLEVSEELNSNSSNSESGLGSNSSSCNTSYSSANTSSSCNTSMSINNSNSTNNTSSNSNSSSSSRRKSQAPQRLLMPAAAAAAEAAAEAVDPPLAQSTPRLKHKEEKLDASRQVKVELMEEFAQPLDLSPKSSPQKSVATTAALSTATTTATSTATSTSTSAAAAAAAAVAALKPLAMKSPNSAKNSANRSQAKASVSGGRVSKSLGSSNSGSSSSSSSRIQKQRSAAAQSAGGSSRSQRSRQRKPKRTFDCNQCGQNFECLADLSKHTMDVHKAYRCSFCNVAFTQRSNLQRHSLKHAGYKPFECRCCGKAYYRKDHLARHIEVTHPGQDPKLGAKARVSSAECLQFLHRKRQVEQQKQLAAAAAAEVAAAADVKQLLHDNQHHHVDHDEDDDEEMIDVGVSEFDNNCDSNVSAEQQS